MSEGRLVRSGEAQRIYDFISDRKCGIVLIRGVSGSGKSHLLSRILKDFGETPLTLVSSFRVDGPFEHPLRPLVSLFGTLISHLPEEDWRGEDLTPTSRFFKVFEGIESGEGREVIEIISTLIPFCPGLLEKEPGKGTDLSFHYPSLKRVYALIEEAPQVLKKVLLEMLKTLAGRVSSPGPLGYKVMIAIDGVELLPPVTLEILGLLTANLPSGIFFILSGDFEKSPLREYPSFQNILKLEMAPLTADEGSLLLKDLTDIDIEPSTLSDLWKDTPLYPSNLVHWSFSKDFSLKTMDPDSMKSGRYIMENLSSLPERYQDYLKSLSLLPMPPTGFFRDIKMVAERESHGFALHEFQKRTGERDILKGDGIPWFSTRFVKRVISSSIPPELKKGKVQSILRFLEKRYPRELKARTLFPLNSIYASLISDLEGDMEKAFNETFQQGILHFRIGSFETARLFFEHAQNIGAVVKDPVKTAASQNGLGLTFLHRGNPHPASLFFKKALESIGPSSIPELTMTVLYNLGRSLLEWGKDDPEPLFRRLIELADKTRDFEMYLKGLLALMEFYRSAGKREDALHLIDEGLERIEKAGEVERKEVMAFFEDSAILSLGAGDFSRALKLTERVLPMLEKSSVKEEGTIARVHLILGNIHERMGQVEKALEYYRKVLAFVEKGENLELHWKLLNLIGISFASSGLVGEAKKRLSTALHILKGYGDTGGLARVMNNLGMVIFRDGDYYEGIAKVEESLRLKREGGEKGGMATSLSNLATIYLYMNKVDDALSYIEEAVKTARESGSRRVISSVLNNRGFIMERVGRFEEAMETYRESLESREEGGDLPGRRTTLINLTSLFIEMGNWKKALTLMEEVVGIDRKLSLPSLDRDRKFLQRLSGLIEKKEG